jgi:hypothetical protein
MQYFLLRKYVLETFTKLTLIFLFSVVQKDIQVQNICVTPIIVIIQVSACYILR